MFGASMAAIENYFPLKILANARIDKVIDWRKITRENYMQAMERSPINDLELRYLLQNALTTEIDDRDVIFHGLDKSYYYEGYEPE